MKEVTMARSEYTKKSIATTTARFVRKAAGRITKREAAKLGRLYGEDLHWKYLGVSGDKLADRKPGDFAVSWKDTKWGAHSAEIAFKREVRTPRRYEHSSRGYFIEHRLAFLFGWYGPSSGLFPGDKLVKAAPREDGLPSGWVVACASDCPCGKCLKVAA